MIAAMSIAVSLTAGGVLAHGSGMTTMPADGQVVAANTKAIHLMFDAPMRITKVSLVTPVGSSYKLNGPAASKPVKVWEGKLPRLAPGSYKVEWRGMSPDGHPMKGSFSFSVEQ